MAATARLTAQLDRIAAQLAAEDAGAWSAAVEHLPGPDDPPPLPGPLPPGSQMPFGRNALFTGRQRDLRALAGLLLHGPGRAAVTGWGGVGKTQLAVEFCHRYGRFFHGGVFWLNAASPETLAADLAQCGLSMGLQPWPDKRPEQIAAVLRAWQSGELRLVMLDNLEDLDLARAWLPQLGGVRLLITARRRQWPADLAIAEHPLDVLARAESLALLRQLAPRLVKQPDGELDPVANALGDLPLAVDLAGRYLADRPGLSLAGYQEELAQAGISAHTSFVDWTEGGDSPTGHATSLAATFLVSWGRLKPDAAVDALAAKLFRAAAWCAASAPIPRAVFYRLEDGQEAAVDRALKRLAVLGLLGGDDEEGPLIHPLLAEFGQRLETGAASPLPALAEGLADLAKEANAEMDRTGSFAPHQALWPHVQAVAGRAEADAPEAAGSLWNNLGYHLKRMADYANARAAFERALAIDERTFGPDHPNVAMTSTTWAWSCRTWATCPPPAPPSSAPWPSTSAPSAPTTPTWPSDVNNLGSVLQDLGDLPAARAAFERALAIDSAAFGPDHPNVAIDVNNLGMVLQDLGDLPAARAAFERALAIDERSLRPRPPQRGQRRQQPGHGPAGPGRPARGPRRLRARPGHRRAQPSAPTTPTWPSDVNNLGRVLKAQGDLAGARRAFERALAIFEQRLPPEHPYIRDRTQQPGVRSVGEPRIGRSADQSGGFSRAVGSRQMADGGPLTAGF